MPEQTIHYQQSEIYYRAEGKGDIVLLIHGFPADGSMWDGQLDFLKDHFRVIVPDLPGSGRSGLVEGATIDTYATVIKLILEQEVRNTPSASVTIVGHSMGGYIALAFAEKYPAAINSLVLFHSSAFADSEEKKAARNKAIGFIRDNGAAAFLKTTVPPMFTKAFNETHAAQVNSFIAKGAGFTPDALVQYYEAMKNRPDRINVLQSFPGKVQFIIGEHDTAIPLESSLKQCYLPAISHVAILEQSAHMGMWEEKEKSNQLLFEFLN